jgi:TldD protein
MIPQPHSTLALPLANFKQPDCIVNQVQATLLANSALTLTQANKVLALACGSRADDGDLYFEQKISEGWALEEGRVKSGSFSIDYGVGLRVVVGEKSTFAYSDDISLKALQGVAKSMQLQDSNSTDLIAKKAPKKLIIATPAEQRLYSTDNPIGRLDSLQKIALLEKIEQFARAIDPRVKKVSASLGGSYATVLVMRLDGHTAADIRPMVRVGVQVIVEQDGRREEGYAGGGGRFGMDELDDGLLKRLAQQAVQGALTNLHAKPAPAGTMSVVLGNGWPGIMLHEAIGHGLEADHIRKGSSAFAGKFGKRVAAKGVTVVDDGTLSRRRGSLNIDDEGNPSQRTVLIEDGKLVGCLQDRLNARLMGQSVTGNARRESYAHLPMPRMTNTYMLGGSLDKQAIIESVKHGIYCPNFGGGQVDTTSGKFVFSCTEAWMIENGRITYPVKGATLIGNGPEALKYITHIGNDLAFDEGVGVCGKEGQSVPVGVGQPTVCMEGLTVGGSA